MGTQKSRDARPPKKRSRTPARPATAGKKSGVKAGVSILSAKQREVFFDAMIGAFPDYAMIVDRDGKFISCNSQVLQKLTKSRDCRRHSIFDIFPHIKPENWKKMFIKYRDDQKAIPFERNVDGQFFHHNLYPVTDGRGNIGFIVVFVQEITGQRQAENALKESEQKYRDLVENISDTIYALNEEGTVIYINPAVEGFLGYSQEEVKGRPFQEFLHGAEVGLVMNDLEGFWAGRTAQREYRFLHKNGSARWGRVSSRPVVFKEEVIGYQGSIADVTQTKTFNINLLKTVQDNILSSLAAAFAAGIGVPLKRARERLLALTVPAGFDRELNLPLRDLMHDLEGMSLYLKHFQAFSSGEGETLRPLDINTLAESALILLKQEMASTGIEVESDLARDLEQVAADSFSLVQAFVNIFTYSLHACVATPAECRPRRIAIATSMDKDRVVVEWRDSSEGMSDELLAHLADPFYTHRHRQGAGIGLAIARQLVESQGGVFQIISGEKTGGLHIRISFPSVIPTL